MKRNFRSIHIDIYRGALETIFDECDRYERDETGGRLIGTFKESFTGKLTLTLSGVIEPGPKTSRSAVSLYQDGDYQERVFRAVEAKHPKIEHLGNWHTHHVNGYPTLSSGDQQTYHRIVNHEKHNTNIFYALLVTQKNHNGKSLARYEVKHFLFFRGDRSQYEIAEDQIRILDEKLIWPSAGINIDIPEKSDVVEAPVAITDQRARDNEFFNELRPDLKPYLTKTGKRVYWRGPLQLVDDTTVDVVVAELDEDGPPAYGIVVKGEPAEMNALVRTVSDERFRSARQAVMLIERELNRGIYRLHAQTRHNSKEKE
jgi:hypothetical protein